ELERALDQLARLDEVRVSVELADEPTVRVIDELARQASMPVRADWGALELIGIDPRDRVTLDLASASLATALAGVAMQIGDGLDVPVIEAHAGYVVLTTFDATAKLTMSDVYDVRDLLTDEEAASRMREARELARDRQPPDPEPEATSQPESEPDEEPDAAPDTQPAPAGGPAGLGRLTEEELAKLREQAPAPRRSPAGELMAIIAEHVDPEGFVDFGGARTSITDRGGLVMVSAPPSVHHRFRDMLARLRTARRTAVAVEAAVVDLPRTQLATLTRRYDLSSARLARAVIRDREAHVRWRTTSAALIDRELSVESQEGEGILVAVKMVPRFDKAAGTLTVDLDVSTRHGQDHRSLRTTVPIPPRDGGAVLELPAGTAGESVRLLVLIPQK
ncbi:MAG: hypothetical protein ACYTGP_00800, partial [Planctomycetota bacterium]